MTFNQIVHSIPEWLNGQGPESGMVISSRARLARNITGIPYAHRIDEEKQGDVVTSVLESGVAAGFDAANYFPNTDLDDHQKKIFIERQLISPALAAKSGKCGVLVENGEKSSILINEEDHLRIQSFRSGFDPMEAFVAADEIDNKLSEVIEFSFSNDYGYLTACPTNMGTGLRVSILVHLPALVITKEIQRVIRSSGQLGLAVRGYFGEGSDIVGNLFQISNQRSLGKSGYEIVDTLISVVSRIIEYEKQAAETLIKEAKSQTEDKVWRSIGILKTARVLSTHEFMNLSSAARLGCYLNMLDRKYLLTLNELLVLTQPEHLQKYAGQRAEAMERDYLRAELIRERFVDLRM